MNIDTVNGSTLDLPRVDFDIDGVTMVENVEKTCNELIKYHPYCNFNDWKEYYLAWAESDGRYPKKESGYKDPHQALLGYPHWSIKYHAEALRSLEINHLKIELKKIVGCVLGLSCGKFSREMIDDKYLKIISQIENSLWIAGVAIYTTMGNPGEKGFQGILIVLSVTKEENEALKCVDNFVTERGNQFVKLDNFSSMIEFTGDGCIIPEHYITDDSTLFERKDKYIGILYKNLFPMHKKLQALSPKKTLSDLNKSYLVYIKAQIKKTCSLELSPAQDFFLRYVDTHYRMCNRLKIKFFKNAYESLKRSENISGILEVIFRVASGNLRYEEIMKKTLAFDFENSIIVIYRSYIQPITLCISVFREDIHSKENILLNYDYCLSVLSVERFLTIREINCYFEEGIIDKMIMNIPQERLETSIYDLIFIKKGIISFKDLSEKSIIKHKKIYKTNNIKHHNNEMINQILESSEIAFKISSKQCIYFEIHYKKLNEAVCMLDELFELKNHSFQQALKHKSAELIKNQEKLNINERFLKFINVLDNLKSNLTKLNKLGYPNLITDKIFFCKDEKFGCLWRYDREISYKTKDWVRFLIECYASDYWLTFLSGHEFWNIYELIWSQSSSEVTNFLMRFMQKDYQSMAEEAKMCFKERAILIANKYKSNDDLPYLKEKLALVGEFLEAIPNLHQKGHDFSDILKERNSIRFDGERILIYEGKDIFGALISIYVNSIAEVPKLHQVLFCKKKTQWREINAFLHRWLISPKFSIFTIVECENLKFKYKAKFLELFIKLFKQCREICNYKPFAILTKCADSEIANALNHKANIRITKIKDNQILTDKQLSKVIKIIDSSTQVHTSTCVGLGKTTRIREIAKSQKLAYYETRVSGEVSYSTDYFQPINCQIGVLYHLGIGIVEDCSYLNEDSECLSPKIINFTCLKVQYYA